MSERITILDFVESAIGLRAIADEIKVPPVSAHITVDEEIAKRIVNTLKWNTSIADDNVQGRVSKRWSMLAMKVSGAVKPTWHSNSAVMQYSPSYSMSAVAELRFHFFSVESKEDIRRNNG